MRGLKILIGVAMMASCLSSTGWCKDVLSERTNLIISDLIIRSVAGTFRIPEEKFTVAGVSYTNSGGNRYAGSANVTMAGTGTRTNFPVSFSMMSDNRTVSLKIDDPKPAFQAAMSNETYKRYRLSSGNNQSPENAKPITAQYSDFKWGMPKTEAHKLVLSQGKENVSVYAADDPEGNIFQFDDIILNEHVIVKLYFTPNSEKLFKVLIGGLDAFHNDALISSLNKKYGKYAASMSGEGYYWGSSKEGDRIEISRGGNPLVYSNVEGLALAEKEKQELYDKSQGVKGDASKKGKSH